MEKAQNALKRLLVETWMLIKGNSGKGSERREESYREQRTRLREHTYPCEQNVAKI